VRWDEDAEHSNVDTRYGESGTPFYSLDCLSRLGNDTDSVDDDLHQKLDLKYPEE
jgi:hypothetical protein